MGRGSFEEGLRRTTRKHCVLFSAGTCLCVTRRGGSEGEGRGEGEGGDVCVGRGGGTSKALHRRCNVLTCI